MLQSLYNPSILATLRTVVLANGLHHEGTIIAWLEMLTAWLLVTLLGMLLCSTNDTDIINYTKKNGSVTSELHHVPFYWVHESRPLSSILVTSVRLNLFYLHVL